MLIDPSLINLDCPLKLQARSLRYCARPPFALERLEQVGEHRVIYRLPKPRRDGCTKLVLTPLEFIDHLGALIPPPRLHRHRYHGVLAPNSPLRLAAAAHGRTGDKSGEPLPWTPSPAVYATPSFRSAARCLWAMLLARLFESLPLRCPNCGADMRIIAFITETTPVRRILNTSVSRQAHPRSPPPADLPPGTMLRSRRRTGAS